jgi:DNA-binding transcriptional LysR family regulator
MELKLIQHALAVGEELNFARAAERVHLSQPALSRSIQNLESQLGFRLFVRDHHRVTLSPQGRFFLQRARRLAEEARRLQQDVRHLGGKLATDVIFGCEATAAPLLDPVLAALIGQEPAQRWLVRQGNSAQLLRLLEHGEIEFFMGEATASTEQARLQCTPLTQADLSLRCRRGHPLLHLQQEVIRARVLSYGLASTPLREDARQRVGQWLGQDCSRLPLKLECDDPRLLARLVRHSDLILLGTCSAGDDGLCELAQPRSSVTWHRLQLIRLAGCELSAGAHRVVEQLCTAFAPEVR